MAVSEDVIAKILQLIPTHPTLGAVMGANALRDVHTADILAAICILEERGNVRKGELLGRNSPPQGAL